MTLPRRGQILEIDDPLVLPACATTILIRREKHLCRLSGFLAVVDPLSAATCAPLRRNDDAIVLLCSFCDQSMVRLTSSVSKRWGARIVYREGNVCVICGSHEILVAACAAVRLLVLHGRCAACAALVLVLMHIPLCRLCGSASRLLQRADGLLRFCGFYTFLHARAACGCG
jgi:hypothetical protein